MLVDTKPEQAEELIDVLVPAPKETTAVSTENEPAAPAPFEYVEEN